MRVRGPSLEEWTFLRKDGTPVVIEVSAKLLPDGHLQALARDVTDRRRAQDALRAAEERLRLTINGAPIGMAVVALDGRFVRANKALCELVGYTADELQRLRFQDITHPGDLADDLGLMQRLLSGAISRYELPKRYVRKDGSIVDIVLHGPSSATPPVRPSTSSRKSSMSPSDFAPSATASDCSPPSRRSANGCAR